MIAFEFPDQKCDKFIENAKIEHSSPYWKSSQPIRFIVEELGKVFLD